MNVNYFADTAVPFFTLAISHMPMHIKRLRAEDRDFINPIENGRTVVLDSNKNIKSHP